MTGYMAFVCEPNLTLISCELKNEGARELKIEGTLCTGREKALSLHFSASIAYLMSLP